MSFRRASPAYSGLVLSVTAMTILLAAAALPACSDDDDAPGDAGKAETSLAEANRPAPPEAEPALPKTCRERCVEAHPAAVAKDEAIVTCWQNTCLAPCIEEMPASSAAPLDGGADAGTCVSPVVTATPSCDACTTAFCCSEWDACFQDAECSELNTCYQDCPD